jgi:hypothetical protein
MALRNIDDLFEMLRFKDRCRSVARTGASGRRLKYERALVIACPILLSFAHHCGISAERSATCCFQRGHFPNKSAKKNPRKRGAFS